jgi:hypothetical protein
MQVGDCKAENDLQKQPLGRKEALQAKKATGVKLCRLRGLGKSRLDRYQVEIKVSLPLGHAAVYYHTLWHDGGKPISWTENVWAQMNESLKTQSL